MKKSEVIGTPAFPAGNCPSCVGVTLPGFVLYVPRYAASVGPDARRYSNGTPSHEPPDTVDNAFTCDSIGAPFTLRYDSACNCPIPAVNARDPPPDKHTPTFPGVGAGLA